jgi:hypothetical protein
MADAGSEADEAGAPRDDRSLIPLEGYVDDRHPDYDSNLGRKVSEDGSLIAVWEYLGPNDPEADPSNHYVIVKRVDGDKEIARFFLGDMSDGCLTAHAKPICAKRQARADALLSKHKWLNLRLFWMEPGTDYCYTQRERQRLTFRDFQITITALRVVVTKPTGDILVDRRLSGWRLFPDKPIPPARGFYALSVGLSLAQRVLLVEIEACSNASNADNDPRFHVIRLPEIM